MTDSVIKKPTRLSDDVKLELFQVVLHHIDLAVAVTDRHGHYVYVNREYEMLTGYSASELLGLTPLATPYQGQSVHQTFWKDIEASIEKGVPWFGQLVGQRKKGGSFEHQALLLPVQTKRSKWQILILKDLSKDIGHQQQLFDKLSLANNAQKDAYRILGAGLAHEINNPLQIITAAIDLISQGLTEGELQRDPKKLKALTAKLNSSTERLTDLLSAFKSLSSDLKKQEPKVHSLKSLLEEALRLFQFHFESHSIHVDFQSHLKGEVFGKKGEFLEMFQHILQNTLDASRNWPTDPKQRQLRIHLSETERVFFLNFTDKSPPVSKEMAKQIFEPFFTYNKPRHPGIGLALVKGLVEKSGGQVYADPYGEGFKICLTLPKALKETKEKKASVLPSSHEVLDFKRFQKNRRESRNKIRERILVIDPNPLTSAALIHYLESDYEVLSAHDGFSGIECIKSLPPQSISVMLIEFKLGEMNGLELISRSLFHSPHAKKILLLSHEEQLTAKNSDVAQQIHQLIIKPYGADTIQQEIKRAIQIRNLEIKNDQLHQQITLQKSLMEQKVLEKTNDLTNLLRIISHDVKNPLTLISNWIEVLRTEETLSPHRREKIYQTIHRATSAITQILTRTERLEAIESGKADFYFKRVTFSTIKDHIDFLFKEKAQQKGLDIEFYGDLEVSFWVDQAVFLDSVISNLVSNAIKFSLPNTKISLKATARGKESELVIQDEGIGIPDDLLERLFDPSASTTRKGTEGERGTGFGMPIIHTTLQKWQGKLDIETTTTKPHTGTKITLILPSDEPDQESPDILNLKVAT